jgi:hypothetical protein
MNCRQRLSEKSLDGVWSVGFGGATLQKQALCAPFQQFVRSSAREFESFQTVSQGPFSETPDSPGPLGGVLRRQLTGTGRSTASGPGSFKGLRHLFV